MDVDLNQISDVAAWRKAEIAAEAAAAEALGPIDAELEEYDDVLTLSHGYACPLKVIRPATAAAAAAAHRREEGPRPPLIVLIHGGALIAGSVHQLTRPGRALAQALGAVVVLSTYRLGPESAFPAQFHDCWEVVVAIAATATPRFGAYPEAGFVVGGASAGATLAAVVAQQAVARQLQPPITGSYLAIPLLLVPEIVPERFRAAWTAREENAPFPSVQRATLETWKRRLAIDVTSPLFSPFNAPVATLRGLPPTYLQVGGFDPLRDDGLVYARYLRELGIPTRVDHYPELEHMTCCVFADDSHPPELESNAVAAMAWLLQRTTTV